MKTQNCLFIPQLLGTQSLGKELDNWTRLEQIMDMIEDEFIAKVTEDEDLFLSGCKSF